MCGVAVLFSQGGQIEHEALTKATQVLHHRGPDAAKLWVDPKGPVGLAHARLSIIDLATGDQPLANEDGTLHAIVNGEFYDFERIRAELEGRGHRFSTRSDSEILLHLYEERGPSCLEELRGEFAFALYDSRNRMLFAGRDRFGIKPLFYASHGGNLALASEAKALFALGVPARWDAESVYQASALVVPLQDRSLFAGIQQVPPGHYLLATPNHLRLVAYWDFDFGVEQTQPGRSTSDDIAQLATAIDEAIRLRLRADVPVESISQEASTRASCWAWRRSTSESQFGPSPFPSIARNMMRHRLLVRWPSAPGRSTPSWPSDRWISPAISRTRSGTPKH